MGFHVVSGNSTDHAHSPCFGRTTDPKTARTLDISMASDGGAGHLHQYSSGGRQHSTLTT